MIVDSEERGLALCWRRMFEQGSWGWRQQGSWTCGVENKMRQTRVEVFDDGDGEMQMRSDCGVGGRTGACSSSIELVVLIVRRAAVT